MRHFRYLIGFLAAGALSPLSAASLDWDNVPPSVLTNTVFKSVDSSVVNHAHEQRGFVRVPLDYAKPKGKNISIFYRLMPSIGSKPSDGEKPILVVMNGGPGAASSGYRPLEHNYLGENDRDAYKDLAKYFRILAVDQRGTGHSAPLDLDNGNLSAEVIAKYFDADEHARDHAAVINQVIPSGEAFFILARSYGGHIGFNYLIGEGFRKPAGMILSSAIQPHMSGVEVFAKRREKQRQLNFELRDTHPQVRIKLNQLRDHLASLGLDPKMVNYLWNYLGKKVGWASALDKKLDALLAMKDAIAIQQTFSTSMMSSVNLLNYVLSSSALTPGYTDGTITAKISELVPFEPWMLDESWTLNQIGNDGSWRDGFIAAVDQTPPPAPSFPGINNIRQAIAKQQVLFTFGRTDSFLDQPLQLKNAKRFAVKEHTQFQVFDGGHGAAFSPEGAKFVAKWAQDRL